MRGNKIGLAIAIVAVILLAVLGLAYFVLGGGLSDSKGVGGAEKELKYSMMQSEMDAKNAQIQRLEALNNELKASANSISDVLNYIIAPKDKLVSACENMKLGKWAINKKCLEELKKGVQEVSKDNKVVAIEVTGIVDSTPYHKPLAELKQEGLGAMRAKEAMMEISKIVPDVAVFEGLTKQTRGKRGFEVRAYFVDKK